MARVQFLATVFDTRQRNQQGVLAIKLKRIYEQMCQEAAKIGLSTHFSDPAKEFYLKDFPNAEKAVSALLRTYSANITSLIDQGTLDAWELSEQKNAKMAEAVASAKGMSEEEAASFAPRNREGLEAFRQRRVNGMNLSERVWDFVQHDKQKLELALEVGLTDGRSAAKLSRDVREYLDKPDKLFRRVRDRDGNLRLSKAAAAYHPGRGVYRSSYKNALRMTATETNMAYRTADHEAWANMPFVTGIIINLSKNHTCLDRNGVPRPFHDICDELKGEYPKDFKYVGWHPHCRCYVTAKLADQEEIDRYAVASDEERENFHFSNEVKDVPENFTSWVDDNTERLEKAASIPYFIKDNPGIIQDVAAAPEIIGQSMKNSFKDSILSFFGGFNISKPLEEEISGPILQFLTASKGLIKGKLTGINQQAMYGSGDMAMTYTTGIGAERSSTITIASSDVPVVIRGKAVKFNPKEKLREAIAAIKEGKDLDFSQEYALENVWHEIMHCGAVQWKDMAKAADVTYIAPMECINQFCSRMSYGSLIRGLGGKQRWQAEIMEFGIGYDVQVANFRKLLKTLKVTDDEAYRYFKGKIKNNYYDDMRSYMIKFISTKTKAPASKIGALVDALSYEKRFALLMGEL